MGGWVEYRSHLENLFCLENRPKTVYIYNTKKIGSRGRQGGLSARPYPVFLWNFFNFAKPLPILSSSSESSRKVNYFTKMLGLHFRMCVEQD